MLPVIHAGWSCDRHDDHVATGLDSLFPKTDKAALNTVRQRVKDGATLVVGLSGGKDSVSVCLLLKELNLPFVAIFTDTEWEAGVTYSYIEWFCKGHGIELLRTTSETYNGLMDLIQRRGCFPKMKRRFCTEELKEMPIAEVLSKMGDVISVAGIRAEESKQRAKMQTWVEHDDRFGCSVWHPIFTWTYEDTIAMHHRHHTKPNPLYLLGAERVGCFPCVFGKKSELRIVSVVEPNRIPLIRDTETAVDTIVREKMGDRYEVRNYPTSTMFWMSVNGQSRPVLIDDVIERAWKPANRKEAALIEDNLASQAAAAQKRWGFSLVIDGKDLSEGYTKDLGAIHADYSFRYLTSKELKERKHGKQLDFLELPKGESV